jgi:NAD(P)-dependent dehydrogenase (short-subunit alcohol dehydrogenase family)
VSYLKGAYPVLSILQLGSGVLLVLGMAYSVLLLGFRSSVKEVEGGMISALREDLGILVLLALVWVVMTNSWLLTLQQDGDLDLTSMGAVGFLYGYVAFASTRHPIENYLQHVRGQKYPEVDLQKKVYIVTGSNQGCGFETALALVSMGATVVMACRSEERAQRARQDIIDKTGCSPTKLIVLKLNLSSFQSVRDFVKAFTALKLPLHCLVNNAGLMMDKRCESDDGLEMVISANHLAHFLLTNLLIPALQATAEKESKGKKFAQAGRVVNLSSALHKTVSQYDFSDFMFEKPGAYSMFPNYCQSKLANVLFTDALQARMDKAGIPVVVNAVHPGCVMTDVSRNMHWLMRYGEQMAYPILSLIRKTPAEGAYCSIYAASATEIDTESIKGEYLFHCMPASKGPAVTKADAEKLWAVSEGYVKQKFAY